MQDTELTALVARAIITQAQADNIRAFRNESQPIRTEPVIEEKKHFNLFDILYFLGGSFIVMAITYFVGRSWEDLSTFGQFAIPFVFSVAAGGLGTYLYQRTHRFAGEVLLLLAAILFVPALYLFLFLVQIEPTTATPGGTVATLAIYAISLALAIYGYRKMHANILTLLISTYASLGILHLISGLTGQAFFDFFGSKAGLWYGLVISILVILAGTYYHLKINRQVGLWPWLFGHICASIYLLVLRMSSFDYYTSLENNALPYILLIGAYGLVSLLTAKYTQSKIFITFGALALFWFVQDVYWTYFSESIGFEISLLVAGFLIIGLAFALQRYYKSQFVTQPTPAQLPESN